MKRAYFLYLFIFTIFIINWNVQAQQAERKEAGNLVMEDIPEIPADFQDGILQYQSPRYARFAGWSGDGKGIYIITRFGETDQVHFISEPGGYRKQLTFFQEPISDCAVRPSSADAGFLFSKDLGGNEMYQIFYFNAKTNTYEMCTDGKSRNEGFVWSHDGSAYAFVSNRRNGKDFDVYVTRVSNPKFAELVYQSEGSWNVLGWSSDDSKLLINHYISINDSKIFILDLQNGKTKPIQEGEGQIAMGPARWLKNGQGIYFTSDLNSEFQKLQYYDVATGQSRVVTKLISWDAEEIALSDDGKLVAVTTNENGISKLYFVNTENNVISDPKNIPNGLISDLKFSPDSKYLAMTINDYKSPGDVLVMNVEDNSLVKWTFSETGGLNVSQFVEPKLIFYQTFDKEDRKQRMIPAYYYRPNLRGPFPAIIYFHGGPEGQFRPAFNPMFQYFCNVLGIAIIAPNVRGSSGYGKSFLKLDDGMLRENSVKDGGELLDWMKKQREIDSKKIGVFGGSYGGYMVLSTMCNYNSNIAAGVDVVGISNFVTFLENTGEYRKDLRRAEYGDERNTEMKKFLTQISPATNAGKITKPLFVVQGLNDPRVPASESEQMVAEIRKNKGKVWYLLAKDEGHGFRKKSNRDYYTAAVGYFFKTFLTK